MTQPGDWIRVVTQSTPDIGKIKEDFRFTPTPSGGGRAVAFVPGSPDILYYTFVGDSNIYQVRLPDLANLGPIPLAGRTFTCGALDWDGTDLWCGTYDGTGTGGAGTADVYRINRTTGIFVLAFNSLAFGGFVGDGCFGDASFIDAIAVDTDGSVWTSADGATRIFHVTAAGALLSSFRTPTRPGGVGFGCNSGIEIVPGPALELVLIAFEPAGDGVSHHIVKIDKVDNIDNPPLILSFPTTDPLCCEDLSEDPKTLAPRCLLWANGQTGRGKLSTKAKSG